MDDFPIPIFERVTQILSPFSGFDKIEPYILEKAATRGTAVHEIIECLQEGLPTGNIPDDLIGYINSYNVWAHGKKFLDRPKRFFDDTHMITGECDCLYDLQGDVILVDFKTSANEGKTWKYQGAAYSYLAKKAGIDVKAIEFVKLSKDGKPARSYLYSEAEHLQGFFTLLKVYREFFSGCKSDMGDL